MSGDSEAVNLRVSTKKNELQYFRKNSLNFRIYKNSDFCEWNSVNNWTEIQYWQIQPQFHLLLLLKKNIAGQKISKELANAACLHKLKLAVVGKTRNWHNLFNISLLSSKRCLKRWWYFWNMALQKACTSCAWILTIKESTK